MCEMWHLAADELGVGNSHGRESCMDLMIVDWNENVVGKIDKCEM